MGVKQHLGPFLSNLVKDTQENKETLLTVNASINNQLAKLDSMITELGKVENATLNTLGYKAIASDQLQYTYPDIINTSPDGYITQVEWLAGIQGSVKMKASITDKDGDGVYKRMYFTLNGTQVGSVPAVNNGGTANLETVININIDDKIGIKADANGVNIDITNITVNYDPIIQDYSKPDNAILKL